MKSLIGALAVTVALTEGDVQKDGSPGFAFPQPTGPHAVGTRFLHLADESRLDEFSPDPEDHRWVSVQIWYPAAPSAEARPLPYLARPFLANEDAIGPIDGKRFLDIQKGYVLQFLDRYLKGRPAPLLDGPLPEYPEVRSESRIAAEPAAGPPRRRSASAP
jgi:hypothetical protein